MKVWITLRIETTYTQEPYESPDIYEKLKTGDVFSSLEKAKDYIEQLIEQDMQTTFSKRNNPIERDERIDDDGREFRITLVYKDFEPRGMLDYYEHSIEYIVLEKEVT